VGYKSACLAAILFSSAVAGVAADEALEDDSVLRLHLTDTVVSTLPPEKLRPRFEARYVAGTGAEPTPQVSLSEAAGLASSRKYRPRTRTWF